MDARLLQDWITIRGSDGDIPIAQDPSRYLDVRDVIDLVLWTQVSRVDDTHGAVELSIQTAPAPDEPLFQNVLATFNLSNDALIVSKIALSQALAAPSTWLRWRLNGGASQREFEATFRIWASFSRAGAPFPMWNDERGDASLR